MKTKTAAITAAPEASAEMLGNIRHFLECAIAPLSSLEKTLWWIAERTSDEEVCSVFYTIGNSIEAIKQELDAAVDDLGAFEKRMVRP